MSPSRYALHGKVDAVIKAISKKDGLVVAFSGGVDSTVLAKLAYMVLGSKAIAVTEDSELMPRSELKESKELARLIGIKQVVMRSRCLTSEKIVSNPSDRCYHCRKGLTLILKTVAKAHKIRTIADGANISDLGEHRPGIKAADEGGVWHPFIEFDVKKSDIRAMARLFRLPIHKKPAAACLASRIPYGQRITKDKLSQIEKAEAYLKGLGLSNVRVRHHGDIARIEVPPPDFKRFHSEKFREKVTKRLNGLGFDYVTIDLIGYRAGSMDEAISRE